MGTKYGSFAVGDANIDNVMLQLAGVEIGFCALTLTEMTTTNVPQIAAGSKIEVSGSLFKFDANETITGTASTFDPATSSTASNFIRLVPSGSSITAEWTVTAPTWSDSKQGWYDSTGAKRYIPFTVVKTSTMQYYKIEGGWMEPTNSPSSLLATSESTSPVSSTFWVMRDCAVTFSASNNGTLLLMQRMHPSIDTTIYDGSLNTTRLLLTPGRYYSVWTPPNSTFSTFAANILSSNSSLSKTASSYILAG